MRLAIEIDGISDELLSQLGERARQIGVDRVAFVRRLIERAVAPPSEWQPLSEFLAPLHDYTEAHGLTEEKIESFFSEQIVEARRERTNTPRARAKTLFVLDLDVERRQESRP